MKSLFILSLMICFTILGCEHQAHNGLEAMEEMKLTYDKPPQPIGGFNAIQKALRYPESARIDGREGEVLVKVTVEGNGDVIDTLVVRSPYEDLSRPAVEAVKQVKWIPAFKDNEPIRLRL